MQPLPKVEPTDAFGRDALGVADGLADGEVAGEIDLMHALKATEEGTQHLAHWLGMSEETKRWRGSGVRLTG